MKLKYYGTAAAEGFPGMFCECDACKRAKMAAGKNIRTRCQALVNDKLLIDLPPDMLMHIYDYGLNVFNIENILITHSHPDHLLINNINMISPSYANLEKEKQLNIYSSEYTINQIKAEIKRPERVKLQVLEEFVPVVLDGVEVTAFPALHGNNIQPFIYDFREISTQKRMLYAHDTAFIPDVAWDYIKKHKIKYDLVSLDCTHGIKPSGVNHMGIETDAEIKRLMLRDGIADKNTTFVLHHFSHNGEATYDEMVPVAEKHGFLVSYDTMEIEI